ncbi:helix-turn-helix domain-containing protein [Bacillus safensis]|uniref:helix-turn-helix domain-containing protein n=1 Tax=Bacillus safensis TaxID=561879 RepID=UPI003983BC61
MGTRVSYPVEVKQKAVDMRLAGVPMKEIMQKLNIKNKTQVQTWVRWHKAGECLRTVCYIATKVLCIHLTSIRKLFI